MGYNYFIIKARGNNVGFFCLPSFLLPQKKTVT